MTNETSQTTPTSAATAPVAGSAAKAGPSGRTTRILVALAGVGLVLAATVGSAAAASPAPRAAASGAPSGEHRFCVAEWAAAAANRSVETLRAVGDCEVDRRITTLNELDARVAGSAILTPDHANQLRHSGPNPVNYDAEKAGLTALKAKIDGETDIAELRLDIEAIAKDYRVYLLVVPKTHLVTAADAGDKAVDKLGEVATRLEEAIAKAAGQGKDVTQANALLADLKAKAAQADALIAPIAGSVMPISAADFNAGPGKTAIDNARESARQARDLLKGAREDARQIIALLKA